MFRRGFRTLGTWGASSAFVPGLPVANVSLSPLSANEGNTGTNTRTVTVTLTSAAGGGGASVAWAVTATGTNPASASDFQGGVFPSGTISITSGNTTGTGTITILADTDAEPDETFRVTLSAPSGCVLGTATVDGTIANDDAMAAFYDPDATATTDRTSSWHADTVIRTPSHIVMGYSKSGGQFGVGEFNPDTGALVDARVILDEPTQYTSINDHFMVVPWRVQNGTHAGKLWAITLPHGSGTASPGNRRFYCRVSLTGRTEGLLPAGSGVDYLDAGTTHNYGQVQERSDGRICLLTINDAGGPQFARFLFTDDPAVIPTRGRNIFNMSGAPGFTDVASAQLYVNGVPGLSANTMVVYGFLHPSVPDAPIKRFVVNLSDGTVRVGGVAQGSGSIYDTTGSVMLTYGAAPSINAPSGGLFTRLHDVCQYGTYEGGFAVAITQGVQGTSVDAPSHIVRWCDPSNDPEVLGNWSQANIGAANRARTWDGGTTFTGRRYNSDIRFLPPQAGENIRVALIAYEAGNGYRTEIWSGSAPNTMTRVEQTAWALLPRPMRLFVNPGAATDDVQAFVYNFDTYSEFTNFDPGVAQIISFAPIAPTVVSATAVSGIPQQGVAFGATGAVFAGVPDPTVAYQWRVANDGIGTGAANISGATGATYTPVSGDVGKFLQRVDTATNTEGSVSSSSGWSDEVIAAAGFAWADLGSFILLDPAANVTESGGNVSAWASTTADGGTATTWDQSTSGQRPDLISGPPARLDYVAANIDCLAGDATVRAFLKSRGAWMIITRIEPDATSTQNRLAVNFSTLGSATGNRATIRHGSGNAIQSIARRDDSDSASLATGPTVVAGTKYLCAQVCNFSSGGSTHSLWVNGTEYTATGTGGTNPTAGNTNQSSDSLAVRIGSSAGTTATTCFEGKIGAVVIIATGSGGSFTSGEIADALAKYDADYPSW